MADAAVQFLLDNLQQLVAYHSKLIWEAKKEVEQLQNDLRLIKQFLKDTDEKLREENSFRELIRQIRDVVYDAEDVIDSFVLNQATERQWNSCFVNKIKDTSNLQRVAGKVARVRSEVEKIYGGKSRLEFVAEISGGDNWDELIKAPLMREDCIVGFEDEEEKIKSYINECSQKLDVISIVGMGGIGKTTLAGKIYHDSTIKSNFSTRIWACISQEFSKKDVFRSILRQLSTTFETYGKNDEELPECIRTLLKGKSFLIVLDDIWSTSVWDEFQKVLPMDNNKGKVLITSRNEEVAHYANRDRLPQKLNFLTNEESWLLLKYKVFGTDECPNELEALGRSIAERCYGLPLAIHVTGGILATIRSPDEYMDARINRWTEVYNSLNAYLLNDGEKRVEKHLALSYDRLPDHLKDCFLYMAVFPEDFEISTWQLLRLWIAEGFVQVKEHMSLEEAAESYLRYLIKRNLAIINKTRSDGKVKTCRIHDTIRDFCKTKAREENFLQEITRSTDGFLKPSVADIKNYRRICMNSNVMDLVSAKPFGPRVRSFFGHSKEDIILPKETGSAIPAGFKLLRVLEAKGLKFRKIPKDMYRLVQLKYIHLSLDDLKVLPRSFSKLWNIQILLVDTTSRTLKIEADIWKMMHLTHLKTNASTTLSKPGKASLEGANLLTLGTISPESCTNEVFDRAYNLRKLGIRGKLTKLVDGKFDSLRRLENLEKLKLINDVFPEAPCDGSIRALPPPYKFPPELRRLTLSGTFLEWQQMSVLGMLDNLVVLMLKNNAFVGKTWETTDGGFSNLEILHIGETNLVTWEASAHHFPRLRRLELSNCCDLKAIPIEFAELPSLEVLDLYRATQAAANSAKKIRDAAKNSGFKLIM